MLICRKSDKIKLSQEIINVSKQYAPLIEPVGILNIGGGDAVRGSPSRRRRHTETTLYFQWIILQ